VLAIVPCLDRFYNTGSNKTLHKAVQSRFVPNSSLNSVLHYSTHNLVFGEWNKALHTTHLLTVSEFDIFRTPQAALDLMLLLGGKRNFWATTCWNLKISKIGDGQKMLRPELHIIDTKHYTLQSIFVAIKWWFPYKFVNFWWGKAVATQTFKTGRVQNWTHS